MSNKPLPDESEFSINTYINNEDVWANNIGENMCLIRSGHNIVELENTCVGPVIIFGAGPSLDTKQLELIRDRWTDHVIVSDKMLNKATRLGIKPELVVLILAIGFWVFLGWVFYMVAQMGHLGAYIGVYCCASTHSAQIGVPL